MAQTIEAVEQKCLTRFDGQVAQQPVDLLQRLQRNGLLFRAGMRGLGLPLQGIEVTAFQGAAAEVIDQQAAGDGGQQGAWLAYLGQVSAPEQAHEGVLAQVFGAFVAVKAFAQPAEQPLAVIAVEQAEHMLLSGIARGHADLGNG